MSELPVGTVTFLFTDIEGSTRLWEEHADAMRGALARHDEMLGAVVAAHDGHVVKTTGDGLHAAFPTALEAVEAAIAMQLGLAAEPFDPSTPLRARIGVHTCEAQHRDGDYYGSGVNRAARLMNVAHGGQIVVSAATSELVRDTSVELVDLGEHRLRDLAQAEHVFEVRAEGLASGFPPLRSLDALPGNLPVQVSSFVGREADIDRVEHALGDARVVTLTGVGGVGKTRLAVHVAAEVIADYPDGAWLCELAGVSDPDVVWDSVATCLRVAPLPGRTMAESVLEYLAAKRLLLLLDNCEHLLAACAQLVDVVVHRCPAVSVLATSREGLALDGERLLAVPALGVPASGADALDVARSAAVRLFADRATAAKDDFVLSDTNVAAMAVLCRRLDGIPLAIELAAARVRSMSPDDLVGRLDQRFRLLTRGSRAALERHQTLRNTIDWSYGLLDATERRALNRLSVFAGGCDLRAAEGVLADDEVEALDVVDWLSQLVDKSLVDTDDDPATGAVRFRLLESIRQYAQEQLESDGETSELRRRHAEYYAAWSGESRTHLRGRDHQEWTDAAVRDVDNFRAVMDWAVEEGSADHALRLVAPMTVLGAVGEPAMDWAVTACGLPGAADHPLYPEVAAWASWGATRTVDFERAEAFATAARDAEERLGIRHPTVSRAWATLEFFRGDLPRSRAFADEWIQLARHAGDRYELVNALTMLGGVLRLSDRVDDAVVTLEESVRIARDAGIDAALAFSLSFLAQDLPGEDFERALAMLDEAIDVATRIREPMGVATAYGTKGTIAAQRSDWNVALGASADALDLNRQIGDVATGRRNLFIAAAALAKLGAFEPSAVILGKADSMGLRVGSEWSIVLLETIDALLLEQVGERRVTELAARGAAMAFVDVVAHLRTAADGLLESRADPSRSI
jgi:predicted ATPase/class 3 adenylate cyclase